MVLLGKNRKALDKLMNMTREYFTHHKLDISEQKSKIMSFDAATNQCTFQGNQPHSITLQQIVSFKYLGIPISCKPYCMFKDYNEQVKNRARKYLASVISLVKSGPDRSDLAYALWTSCAVPSILYGAEVIPLTQGTIKEIETCQSKVGKFILQTPNSTADVSANIDAGLKPIWSIIAEKVLTYASKTLKQPESFWPRRALSLNISMGYDSPYTRNLIHWKTKVDTTLLSIPKIKKATNRAAILSILKQCETLPTVFAMSTPSSTSKHCWFKKKQWVSDSSISKILCLFRACNASLGNRGPTKDGQFFKNCPLCSKAGVETKNNEAV